MRSLAATQRSLDMETWRDEATPAPARGRALSSSERYRVGDVLGRGGMGEVVSACDEKIGRSVAIKRMRGALPTSETVARFLREARIQSRLEHPAIVPVYELDDTGDEPFFVMKQLAGTTLHDVLVAGKAPRNQLLRAFVDVCLAIEFAHARGVVHRDLKPANVMLGDFGEVYVLDWGIARVTGDEANDRFGDIDTISDVDTAAGAVLGTPGYMSPEQIRGDDDLDGRSDVYALGCILFEILAGRPLHPRGHAGLASTVAGADARPSRIAPELDAPPELDEVCMTATAMARDQRFASARALADAVQRYLDGDRDLALRRDLAKTEVDTAREALARNDRVGALRAAARALALDPHSREPAELVGRLMLEPPKATPPEVEHELLELDHADSRQQMRRSGVAIAAAALFLPVMYFAGLHDTWYLVALSAVIVGGAVLAKVFQTRTGVAPLWLSITFASAFILVLAWELTPVLVAPGVAIIMGSLLAARPMLRRIWLLYALIVAAMLAPWGLQELGWLPRAVEVVGNTLVLHPPTSHLAATNTLVGLALWLLAGPAITILLTRAIVRDRGQLQRKLQLQAWQLRQLVPRA
jgi:serine/threonine-protein kinase